MDASTLRFLLERGPLTKAEILQRFGIDQETLDAWVEQLGRSILIYGDSESISFALKRPIQEIANFPIWEVSSEKSSSYRIGDLIPVEPLGYVVMWEVDPLVGRSSYSQGLPWWLYDLRPQGFLGRTFAHNYAEQLNLTKDFMLWSDDELLIAMSFFPVDSIGNVVLERGDWGTSSFLSFPASRTVSKVSCACCKRLALDALSFEFFSSSAGGEQPKFLVFDESTDKHFIFKFTAHDNNSVTRRWASLLKAEYLASEILRKSGIASSNSEFFDCIDQWFLKVERFDRIGSYGRLGVVSLAALDHEFVGHNDASWSFLGTKLHQQGLISLKDAQTMQKLDAFGRMIGNADMHLGNLSFFHDRTTNIRLAPVYDMLPMLFAPRSSGHVPKNVPEIHLQYSPELTYWREMFPWAMQFWQKLSELPQPDESFKEIALKFIERLNELRPKLDL